ncbi:MAG: glycosyltransferase, partial [Deltaproteobacteria bacterium]|nr:glycosyltransferase [Deltaproteobacteria bacterium]
MSSPSEESAPFDGIVALPAYNEAAALPGLIEAIAAMLPPRCAILVVDDGSADDTAAIAERAAAKFPVVLVRHGRNRGLSAAVRTIL